jgi:hypothetical protein
MKDKIGQNSVEKGQVLEGCLAFFFMLLQFVTTCQFLTDGMLGIA